ncbi:MAG: B12-binding domain-containing radical SAM protein [Chloroflexi bacterium]|nr:B12-binding domain-containing radical SAM protein [Chloroflexota bacterium]
MRITLVNPPNENLIHTEVPPRLNAEVCSLPPLGLLYIEAAASGAGPHEIEILDARAHRWDHDLLQDKIFASKPDILGITGHTHNLLDMLEISRRAKEKKPELFITWGGSHASIFPDQSIAFEEVDAVVVGEGEDSFPELVSVLERGEDISGIPGVLSKKDGTVQGEKNRALPDINKIPVPRREILGIEPYYYVLGKSVVATSLSSSRGCPFHCTFCSTPGKRFRSRSAESIVREMRTCAGLGIREIYFIDDTFNTDRQRVLDICRKINDEGIDVSWNIRGRINLLDQEVLDALKSAGCTRVQVGVETASQEGLKRLRKEITPQEVIDGFKRIKKSGITSAAYFMIGCPHEKSKDDVFETIEFAKNLNPDYCLFGILTPYPGTKIYDEGVEAGVLDPGAWDSFLKNPYPGFSPPVWKEFLSEEELLELLDIAYKKFYLRPGFILKNLFQVRGTKDLMRKAKAGLSIMFPGGHEE